MPRQTGWVRAYACKSGKHVWTDPADAAKCCNGYRRELRVDEWGGTHGYVWVPCEPGQERPPWAR